MVVLVIYEHGLMHTLKFACSPFTLQNHLLQKRVTLKQSI